MRIRDSYQATQFSEQGRSALADPLQALAQWQSNPQGLFWFNWTLADNVRRFRIPFGVAYGTDKNKVKAAAIEAAKSVPYTLFDHGKGPLVWMTGFGDSSINFTLGVWVNATQVKRPTALMSDYLWALDDALAANNIEIPFPQRDVHIRSQVSAQAGFATNNE